MAEASPDLGQGLLVEADRRTSDRISNMALAGLSLLTGLSLGMFMMTFIHGGVGQNPTLEEPAVNLAWQNLQVPRTAQFMQPAKALLPANVISPTQRASVVAAAAADTEDAAAMVSAPSAKEPLAFSRRQAGFAALGAFGALSAWQPESAYAAGSGSIKLAVFDDSDPGAKHTWSIVRGDSSDVTAKKGLLEFKGRSDLNAFKKIPETFILRNLDAKPFPDISSCEGIAITTRQINTKVMKNPLGMGGRDIEDSWPEFKGFTISIGRKGGPAFATKWGYKASFQPPVGDFSTVKIPFKDFTNAWSENQGTPGVYASQTCKENPEVCPDAETLQNLQRMALWAEGQEGRFKAEINDISAYGC